MPFPHQRGDERGDAVRIVLHLAPLAVIDPARVVAADPLAPAVQHQAPVCSDLGSGRIRIAHEDQVGLDAQAGHRRHEPAHADTEPAGEGVRIGPLKGQHDQAGRQSRVRSGKWRATLMLIWKSAGDVRHAPASACQARSSVPDGSVWVFKG